MGHGRMTPAAYDEWWRARVLKETADYAKHILHNWQQGQQPPQQRQLGLNTLGAAQLLPSHQRIALSTVSFSASVPAGITPTNKSTNAASSIISSASRKHHAPSRVASNATAILQPGLAGVAAAATHKTNSVLSTAAKSTASTRLISANLSSKPLQQLQIPAAAESCVSLVSNRQSYAVMGDESYLQTPNFSEMGSSTSSEVMAMLARLEAEITQERSRREAAEAEMRQLMASRGSSKPATNSKS